MVAELRVVVPVRGGGEGHGLGSGVDGGGVQVDGQGADGQEELCPVLASAARVEEHRELARPAGLKPTGESEEANLCCVKHGPLIRYGLVGTAAIALSGRQLRLRKTGPHCREFDVPDKLCQSDTYSHPRVGLS